MGLGYGGGGAIDAPAVGGNYTRGTPNMWTMAAGDQALGQVYLPLGNSAGDYFGSGRSDVENEYSTSLVALDATTGREVWHFQTVHRDVWDYDLGSQVTLVDFPTTDGTVPALILPSKQGQIYVLNRETGESLFPVEEREVPDAAASSRTTCRRRSLFRLCPLNRPALTERDMWGMSPLDQLWCRIQFHRANYRGKYIAPTADQPWIQFRGYNGGTDWGGVAIDPGQGIMIVQLQQTAKLQPPDPRAKADAEVMKPIYEGGNPKSVGEAGPQTGAPYAISVNAGWRVPWTGLLCTKPPYGWIAASTSRQARSCGKPLRKCPEQRTFGFPQCCR